MITQMWNYRAGINIEKEKKSRKESRQEKNNRKEYSMKTFTLYHTYTIHSIQDIRRETQGNKHNTHIHTHIHKCIHKYFKFWLRTGHRKKS